MDTSTLDRLVNFIKEITAIKRQEINLKFLFDNLRNYILAMTLVATGLWLFKHQAMVVPISGMNTLVGMIFVVAGAVLFTLNMMQAGRALTVLGLPTWAKLLLGLVGLVSIQELGTAVIRQLTNSPI